MILVYTEFFRNSTSAPVGEIVLCLGQNVTMSFHLIGKLCHQHRYHSQYLSHCENMPTVAAAAAVAFTMILFTGAHLILFSNVGMSSLHVLKYVLYYYKLL